VRIGMLLITIFVELFVVYGASMSSSCVGSVVL
jgi:hypothetical protein